jgi:hypothetical protein
MNCKPGDLAVVLRSDETTLLGIVDKIVEVVELTTSEEGGPAWGVSKPIKCGCAQNCGEWLDCFPDEILRPIRDPGEDAVDQTLQWLPAPIKEIA